MKNEINPITRSYYEELIKELLKYDTNDLANTLEGVPLQDIEAARAIQRERLIEGREAIKESFKLRK